MIRKFVKTTWKLWMDVPGKPPLWQCAKWDPEVDENDNIIPPKPVERMDGDAFLACLQLPEETD